MLSLSKILPVLVLPIGVTLVLITAGVWLRRRALILVGVVVLYVTSTPLFSDAVARLAENGAERISATEVPPADAIVVLSGGRVLAPGPAAISEWQDADRFFAGVELYRLGKAPRLVFTGGWMPWQPEAPLEGEVLRGFAAAMGVAEEDTLVTGRVSNTAEEAMAVAALLGAEDAGSRIILVTSAFHQPRATALFEQAGLAVTPYAVDFQVSAGRDLTVQDFLPYGSAQRQSERAIREMYGRAFYAIRALW